ALGLLAWRSPTAALRAGAVLALPCAWNLAQGAALLAAPLVAGWLYAGRRWGARTAMPLAAAPLAAIGLGPAFVLLAAGAPTPRQRLAEGAAGSLLIAVAGGLVPATATRTLAGSDTPLGYVTAFTSAPAALAVCAAV